MPVRLLLIIVALLSGCQAQPAALPPNAAAVVAQAEQVVGQLPVKGRAPLTGYRREEFGAGWGDADGDGCSTREEVLARDLQQVAMEGACTVAAGVLLDPYSGARVSFVRGSGTSGDVQIDHVVALANAWQTGAQGWTAQQRAAFANDPMELLAVSGDLNQEKQAGDAATWLPPNKGFRCQYVALQVLVKHRWGLWLTPPEKAAVQRVLDGC